MKRLSLLSCSLGDCKGLVFAKQLAKFIKDNPQLEHISLTGTLLFRNNEEACEVLKSLDHVSSLQRLCFSFGMLANEETGSILGSLLLKRNAIKAINFSGLSLRSAEALRAMVDKGLGKATQLENLDLSECRMTDAGLEAFVDAIVRNSSKNDTYKLRSLAMRRNILSSTSLKTFVKFLSTPFASALENLNLAYLRLFDGAPKNDVREFFEALANHQHLQSLNLSSCNMDADSVSSLFRSLESSKIQSLDISDNAFLQQKPSEVLELLSPVTPRLQNLERIRMLGRITENDSPDSKVVDEAELTQISAFLQALHFNTSLVCLDFDRSLWTFLEVAEQDKRTGLAVSKVRGIMVRNLMTKNLSAVDSEIPLNALPLFMAQQLSNKDRGSQYVRKSAVFQVLQRTIIEILPVLPC